MVGRHELLARSRLGWRPDKPQRRVFQLFLLVLVLLRGLFLPPRHIMREIFGWWLVVWFQWRPENTRGCVFEALMLVRMLLRGRLMGGELRVGSARGMSY